jgi:outer membrane protein OmpA-like peptidoglycan-associated protein
LNGVVFDDKSKHPLSESAVNISLTGTDPIKLKSDTEGKFTTHLSETEKYSIDATSPGFLPYKESFSLPLLQHDTILDHEIFLTPVEKILTIKGRVTNKKTGAPINARINIINRQDASVDLNTTANAGAYSQRVPKTGLYVFTAAHEGFLNTIDSLYYDNDEVTPMTKDLVLQPIEVGVTVRLKNIYFDYNKATLKSESFIELDKVVKLLTENPTVEIEIEGHTDSVGPDDRNEKLSQDRSQSVVDYIVSKGISVNRLQAKGFGESKPIDTNDTDEGRANNRRVEFTVLKT